jgi:hypothetical protein
MKKISPDLIEIIAGLADMKEADYKQTLAISTLIELFIEKGLFTRQEFGAKAAALDQAALKEATRGETVLRAAK